MRVGEKYKKGLRIGLKIAGAGAVVAGGVRMASKAGDPNQPMFGSYSAAESVAPPTSQGSSVGLPTLAAKTSQMAGQSADFASMASQLAQQQRSKSKFGFF
jgi:hypothetical protein